jgi:hypothetical protein
MFAAGAGSLAGWVAAAALKAAPAHAADGDPVTAGQTTDANSETVLRRPGATASTDNALKVRGYGSATGVRAISEDGTGVVGAATGVGLGVRGEGAQGVLGEASGPSASIGVYGVCPSSSGGYGVYGQHSDSATPGAAGGTGVYGESHSSNGFGVYGRCDENLAVTGMTDTGTGGYFVATDHFKGTGLAVSGPAEFSSSGIATVPAGTRRITVDPGQDVNTDTRVLATLLGNPGGTTAVQYVARDTAADRFTIWLTATVPNPTKVAWFQIG